jgi:hypothetical protein
MEPGLLLVNKAQPIESFVSQVFEYDVRTLGQTTGEYIAQCIIALSQYNIYFKNKCNEKQVLLSQKERLIESTLFHLITPAIIKEFKTKKDARMSLLLTDPTLNAIQLEIEVLQDELYLLDGMDKTISELTASFKRELTRRENELYQQRKSS